MIGITGLARSGKDTLANNLAAIIEKDLKCEVKFYSFASAIKGQLEDFLNEYYNISPFTEDTEKKTITRPIMVAHGEQMKKYFGEDIWLKEVLKQIEQDKTLGENIFPIVTDVRFDFEAKKVQEKGGSIIHISRVGNSPPNEIEKKNDPLVYDIADCRHTWPSYSPDKMYECADHAMILWQMFKESNNIWKKT
tara:strand:- start:255 stop:833 length:579 start_codon:yes stop_codon:yes gene_type:complete